MCEYTRGKFGGGWVAKASLVPSPPFLHPATNLALDHQLGYEINVILIRNRSSSEAGEIFKNHNEIRSDRTLRAQK